MDPATCLEILAYGIIFLGGAIANVLVIRGTYLILAKKAPTAYNPQNECKNLLIINLAVADLVIIIVSIPTDVIPGYVGWPFGEFACKFISPIQDVCMGTSALTFAALAIERYLVTKGRPQHSGKRILLGIWLASWLTLGIPFAKYKQIIVDEDRLECDIIWPNIYVARFFLAYCFFLFVGSAITGAICYGSIRRYLARVQKHYVSRDSPNGSSDSFVEQTHKVSTMLCVLVTVFVISVLPLSIFGVLLETKVVTDPKIIYPIYIGTSCLFYGNCLANPIIVLIMSRECRIALCVARILPREENKSKAIGLAPLPGSRPAHLVA